MGFSGSFYVSDGSSMEHRCYRLKKPLKIFLLCLLVYNLFSLPVLLYLLGFIGLPYPAEDYLIFNFNFTFYLDAAVAFVLGIAYVAKHLL
jgi:hypothetical protein